MPKDQGSDQERELVFRDLIDLLDRLIIDYGKQEEQRYRFLSTDAKATGGASIYVDVMCECFPSLMRGLEITSEKEFWIQVNRTG